MNRRHRHARRTHRNVPVRPMDGGDSSWSGLGRIHVVGKRSVRLACMAESSTEEGARGRAPLSGPTDAVSRSWLSARASLRPCSTRRRTRAHHRLGGRPEVVGPASARDHDVRQRLPSLVERRVVQRLAGGLDDVLEQCHHLAHVFGASMSPESSSLPYGIVDHRIGLGGVDGGHATPHCRVVPFRRGRRGCRLAQRPVGSAPLGIASLGGRVLRSGVVRGDQRR